MTDTTDENLSAAIYMLRTTQQHHVQLSAMADIKANILITASSILLSVTIALSPSGEFRLSLALLAAGVLLGLVFAVLAVLPKFKAPGKRRAGGNPLFFGTFADMDEDAFVAEIMTLAGSARSAMEAQARDIHQLGSYLERSKYRWLRRAYLAFLMGLFAGGLAELVTALS
jgi:hypothetical protein